MCEKAARIAELERDIAECENRPTWGKRMNAARAELAHLRNEPPALTRCPRCDSPDPARHPAVQFEGEVQMCPDSFHSEQPISNPALTQGEGSEPVGLWRYKGEKLWHECNEAEYRVLGDNPEDVERRLLYTSSPLPPAGNADPTPREANLGQLAEAWGLAAKMARNEIGGKINEKNLLNLAEKFEGMAKLARDLVPSPQSQGLVEAADICWELYQANFPSASPSELLLLTEAERLIRSRAADIMTAKPPKATR